MSEHNEHCWECDGNKNNHYPGCTYDGTGKRGESPRMGGSDGAKAVFFIFLIIGILVAAFIPILGVGLIVLGAMITKV
jgi:hypothetical protein